MKNLRELISFRLISKSLLSARPFSFYEEESPDREITSTSPTDTASLSGTTPTNVHSSEAQVTESPSHHQVMAVASAASRIAHRNSDDTKKADPLSKVESLQIKFLRLVDRIGVPPENLVVTQVLYRLQLASMIHDGESDVRRPSLKTDRARAIAMEQEASGRSDLEFSFKILVLGKTGVGKSATLNSLFDQTKTATDAFQPATDRIQEFVGSISGIKVSVIDTLGLSSSSSNQHRNRKLLLGVKRFIKKSPPDVVLYFDRVDLIHGGNDEYHLVKLITEVFGSSVWYNTILVLTHSSSPPPERPDGSQMSYEAYVGRCASLLQHQIHRAVSSTKIQNPILFVENHPTCRTNTKGEKILPNGQAWMPQFLLLCIATKALCDASSILKFQDTIQLTKNSGRLPSLPHLLSSFLHPRSLESDGGFDGDADELSDNDEDDYDQLPPIRILTKSQFRKLSKPQRNAYLDELDYRETLYLKKQWKEELRRRKENLTPKNNDNEDGSGASEDDVQVSDMSLPISFDSESPVYRYRCLLGNDLWVMRPVLDSQGWDHDVGFDGVSLEAAHDVRKDIHASIVGQMSKDKYDFNIQSESSAKYTNPRGLSANAGIDFQRSGKDLVCVVHGDAKLKNFGPNWTGGGLSLTSFGNTYFIGAKVEDSISIGRRCQLMMNAGRVGGRGQVAHGGSLGATVRGKDYPVRKDKVSLAATFLSFEKGTVIGSSLQSDFRVGRGFKMSVSANLNSRSAGQVCVKTSSSEHVEIAVVMVVSLVRALLRTRTGDVVE